MNVLSLFDGCSCGQVALERAGIPVDKYFASEIDKYAIQITQKNYPDTFQLGDVTAVTELCKMHPGFFGQVGVFIGGSPCVNLSSAGDRTGIMGEKSILFFQYAELLKVMKPKYFLYENVASMKMKDRKIISEYLDVEPILINSSLLSGQHRERLYWTNIPGVTQPEDRGILLKDILLTDKLFRVAHGNTKGGIWTMEKSPPLTQTFQWNNFPVTIKALSEKEIAYMDREVADGRTHWDFAHHSDVRDAKSRTLVANLYKGVPYNVLKDWGCVRKFHPIEAERLQTLPINYTEGVSDTQRFKMLGNGWTVDVIAHMLSFIPKEDY